MIPRALPAAMLCAALAWTGIRAVPVEAPHPVYPFLRRLSVKGVLDRAFLGSLPLQNREVLRLLASAAGQPERLGEWERRELARYLREFDPELYRKDSRLMYRDSTRSLTGRVEYFLGGYHRDSLPHADAYAFHSFTPRVEGVLTPTLGFVSEATVGAELSRNPRFRINYDPQRGMPYNAKKGRIDSTDLDVISTFDAFRTVLTWGNRNYALEVGNDWNQWGPGIWQHPTFGPHPWFWVQDSLSGNDSGFQGSYLPGGYRRGFRYPGEGPPMTQLRATFAFRDLKYTKFFAEKTGLSNKEQAYVIAHRLEWQAGGLEIGVHEIVAYAGRSFEPIYAIPFVPLKFAEHFVGDKDNIALGFDVNYTLLGRMRVFSELLFDDLLGPLDLFGDYWGNKFAWVLGGEAYDFLVPASVFQFEYARVEPWFYSHHLRNNQLQHFGSLLGSSLPPNSHGIRVRWNKSFASALEVGGEYGLWQRQAKERGSSVFDVHDFDSDGQGKDFLGDHPETRQAFQAEVTSRYRRYLEFKAALGYLLVDDWKSTPEAALSTPTLAAEVRLRY